MKLTFSTESISSAAAMATRTPMAITRFLRRVPSRFAVVARCRNLSKILSVKKG